MIVYVNRRTKKVVTSARFEQLIEEQLDSGVESSDIRKKFLDEWAGSEVEDVVSENEPCTFACCAYNRRNHCTAEEKPENCLKDDLWMAQNG